jgi:hypothetical protein
MSRKLLQEDLQLLRQRATAVSRDQRRIRDLTLERKQGLSVRRYPSRTPVLHRNAGRVYSTPPWRIRPSCPSCSEGVGTPMDRLSSRLHKCPSCGIVVRETGIGTQIEHTGVYLSQML